MAVLVALPVVAAFVAGSPGLALTVLLAAAVAVLGYVYLMPPQAAAPDWAWATTVSWWTWDAGRCRSAGVRSPR